MFQKTMFLLQRSPRMAAAGGSVVREFGGATARCCNCWALLKLWSATRQEKAVNVPERDFGNHFKSLPKDWAKKEKEICQSQSLILVVSVRTFMIFEFSNIKEELVKFKEALEKLQWMTVVWPNCLCVLLWGKVTVKSDRNDFGNSTWLFFYVNIWQIMWWIQKWFYFIFVYYLF